MSKSQYRAAKTMFAFVMAVGLLSRATECFGAAINVDFSCSGGTAGLYSGTAVAPDTGTNWNDVNLSTTYPVKGTTTSGALVDSTNGQTLVTFTIDNAAGMDVAGENPANVAPALMNDFSILDPNTTSTLTITGLVAGAVYDLYFYSENGGYGGCTTKFTFGGNEATAGNFGNPGSFYPNLNYVVLHNLTAAGNRTLSGTITAMFGNLGAVNGFQLVLISLPPPRGTVFMML